MSLDATPPEDRALASCQARLIERLLDGTLAEAIAKPEGDAALAPFAEWVAGFDPRAVAAAAAAVSKWAKPEAS